MKNKYILTFVMCMSLLTACNASGKQEVDKPQEKTEEQGVMTLNNNFRVINTMDVDPSAFVEGLVYEDGKIYLSTGLEEHSTLRVINAETGEEEKKIDIPDQFCEGITILGNYIYQLTWHDGICYVYDKYTLRKLKQFTYRGEGWGITNDGKNLIMSNGSSKLRFINPVDFSVVKTIDVKDASGMPVYNINELEFVDGKLWANVWQQDYLVAINPENGEVHSTLQLGDLRSQLAPDNKYAEVLNGIAYNPKDKTFLITGKFWGKIFEIQL